MTILLPTALLLAGGLPPAPPPVQLEWLSSLSEARRGAAESGDVIFVVVDHAGEGRCDTFLKKTLRDKRVQAAASTAWSLPVSFETHKKKGSCPRFKGVTCNDHRRAGTDLLEGALRRNAGGVMPIPQYLWLDGQGEVLLSVSFEIDAAGLLWCFEEARRRVSPEQAPPRSADSRPPRRLLIGRALELPEDDDRGRGMTEAELEEALDQTQRSFAGLGNVGLMLRIMFTDHPDAVDFVRVELTSVVATYARSRLGPTLHAIGDLSPAPYWVVLEEFHDSKDPAVRHEVAVALEQMGSPEALKLVKRAQRAEKDEDVKGAWIRALGACGAEDKSTRKTLLNLSAKGKSTVEQVCAVLALGYLLPHEDVRERWSELLAEGPSELRLAAACGLALARDRDGLEALEAAAEAAKEEDKPPLERALAVLRGGDLYTLAPDVERLTGDYLARGRVFFGGPERPSGIDED